MKIAISYRGKSLALDVKNVSFFGKFTGLMFRTRETQNLLFEFKKETNTAIHSWFVFFPFLVLWLNEKNDVLEFRIVEPFSTAIVPKILFTRVIEIPFSRWNKDIIQFFVGNEKI